MPDLSVDTVSRYGFALLSVGLAIVSSLFIAEVFGDRHPYFLFLIATVAAAGYGSYGPSLLALALSWLSVDYVLLLSPARPPSFESNPHDAFAFFAVGAAITVLGGSIGAARERAKISTSQSRRELEGQRSIKSTMQMDVLRCKTPEMVHKEIWAHLLAYNMLRTVMAVAAAESGIEPSPGELQRSQTGCNGIRAEDRSGAAEGSPGADR